MKIKDILWIIVIAGTIFMLGRATKRSSTITETITIHDTITWTVYQSKPVYDTIYYPEPDSIIINDTVIKVVDKLVEKDIPEEIINTYVDYFAVKAYKDTLKHDSIATVVLEEESYMNSIQNRKLSFTSNLEYKVPIPASKGFNIGMYGGDNIAMPTLGYETSKLEYNIGYNLPTKSFAFGVKFNLSKIFK